MGRKDAALPESLLKNQTKNCLFFEENTRQPYNDNLCLFRVLDLHLHATQRLKEETSEIFNLFTNKMDGLSADNCRGVHMIDIPFLEDLLTLNSLLYDINIVDGKLIGKHARRNLQKRNITVRLLRYNNHIC